MSIKKRGNSFQSSIVIDGKRYRRSFKTYFEAEKWELESKLRASNGEEVLTKKEIKQKEESEKITWKELGRLVYSHRWKNQKSAKSHKANSEDVIAILGPNVLVRDVRQTDIDRISEVLQREREGISVSTINRKYSALSVLVKYAQKRGYLNKMFEMTKYKEPEHRIRWISSEEETELLEFFAKDKPIVKDFVVILLDTGLRLSELWRLKVNDVTETHLTVWVSKGGKPRSIPLTKRVRTILGKHIEGREKDECIFEGWTNFQMSHYWNKARNHMGMKDDPQFVPHILRHTFCSRLVQKSVPLPHVQRLAGHSDISTTLRYAHLAQADLDQAMLVLEQ